MKREFVYEYRVNREMVSLELINTYLIIYQNNTYTYLKVNGRDELLRIKEEEILGETQLKNKAYMYLSLKNLDISYYTIQKIENPSIFVSGESSVLVLRMRETETRMEKVLELMRKAEKELTKTIDLDFDLYCELRILLDTTDFSKLSEDELMDCHNQYINIVKRWKEGYCSNINSFSTSLK